MATIPNVVAGQQHYVHADFHDTMINTCTYYEFKLGDKQVVIPLLPGLNLFHMIINITIFVSIGLYGK